MTDRLCDSTEPSSVGIHEPSTQIRHSVLEPKVSKIYLGTGLIQDYITIVHIVHVCMTPIPR